MTHSEANHGTAPRIAAKPEDLWPKRPKQILNLDKIRSTDFYLDTKADDFSCGRIWVFSIRAIFWEISVWKTSHPHPYTSWNTLRPHCQSLFYSPVFFSKYTPSLIDTRKFSLESFYICGEVSVLCDNDVSFSSAFCRAIHGSRSS